MTATNSTNSPAPGRAWLSRLPWKAGGGRQELLLLSILIVLLIVFTIAGPGFMSFTNISSMLQDVIETALLAIGETFVIVLAGIDLSVGAVLGLGGVVGAKVMQVTTPALGGVAAFAIGALVVLLVGVVIGLLNGFMIIKARITPFVATLATLGVATGLTLVITNGIDIPGVPPFAVGLGNNVFGGVLTVPIIVAIVVSIIAGVVLHQTQYGRWTFAIGSNRTAASGAGVAVNRHILSVYVLSSTLAAFAGVLVLMRLGTGSPTEGTNDELNAIAAVVIGGASLFGGIGSILGSMLGALILEVVLSGLIISGVPPYWQTVVTGVLIALAVGFQEFTRRRGRRD